MSTTVRAEVSKRNKFWIDRHRYYELTHFCLQYKQWRDVYLSLDGAARVIPECVPYSVTNAYSDPTAKAAAAREYLGEKIVMVDKAAKMADPELADYILRAVTEGESYESIDAKCSIPCSRDTFYDRRRRFFWILDKLRK